MLWHYTCPECGRPLQVEWDHLRTERVCGHCHKRHYPPTPAEDHLAYVGSDRWPKELEEAVVALRGDTCSVPGCFHMYTTLVHRKPESHGGHTSVDNLLPMCSQHARAKGQQDYAEWLRTIAGSAGTEPTMEITLTALHRDEPPPTTRVEVRRGTNTCQTIAQYGELGTTLPEGLRLVVHRLFIPGPARWLVFKYDWRFASGESCGVVLNAWAATEESNFEAPAGAKRALAANTHQRRDGEAGSSRLEVRIQPESEEIWHAAVLLKCAAGTLVLNRYVLAAAD